MPRIELEILEDVMDSVRSKYTCDAGNVLILEAVRGTGPRRLSFKSLSDKKPYDDGNIMANWSTPDGFQRRA
jgi:hypothetical protein